MKKKATRKLKKKEKNLEKRKTTTSILCGMSYHFAHADILYSLATTVFTVFCILFFVT